MSILIFSPFANFGNQSLDAQFSSILYKYLSKGSDAASGWAGLALAHLEFWSLVNPIPTKGNIMPTTLLILHPDLKTSER